MWADLRYVMRRLRNAPLAVLTVMVSLGLALAGGAAAYVLVCRLLRVDELRALRLLRRRPATP